MSICRGPYYLGTKVADELKKSGVDITESVIMLVLDTYLNVKRDTLLKGESVEESGLGIFTPSWRGVSNSFTSKPYTSKVKLELDRSLKRELNEKLYNDESYRAKVGAKDLSKLDEGGNK